MEGLSLRRDVGGIQARIEDFLVFGIQMTIEGLGVACLPEIMVRQELRDGKLEALRYLWSPDALRFSARFEETAPHFVHEAAELAARVSWSDVGVADER